MCSCVWGGYNQSGNELNKLNEPNIILLSPISMKYLSDDEFNNWCYRNFYSQSQILLSQRLPLAYLKLSQEAEFRDIVTFINANDIIQVGSDNLHLDKVGNIKLGKYLAPIVAALLEP